ncbi:putative transcriptional regulator domain protein [Mycobacterium kansasii]|nr:putative transcriptional regulator domain protein [Mycobacterium kansasii]
MNLYLRRRAAARDRWKLANWPTYLASVDTTFVPPVPHTLIQNDPDSQPLQVQARNFVKSIRAQAGQQQGT